MKKQLYTLGVLALMMLVSCNENESSNGHGQDSLEVKVDTVIETKEVEVVEVVTSENVKQFHDSINNIVVSRWDSLIALDDYRLKMMTRLLDEISYMDNSPVFKLEKLKLKIKEIPAWRYTKETLSDEKINDYDAKLGAFMKEYNAFVVSLDETLLSKLAGELYKEVNDIFNNQEVSVRIYYDQSVFRYDEFILRNETELKKQEIKTNNFAVFSIPQA